MSSRLVSRLVVPFLATGLVGSTLLAAGGCGSGSGSRAIASGGSINLPTFLGRTYTSQVALANGQVGTLILTPSGTTTATGTLEINDPSRTLVAPSRAAKVSASTPVVLPDAKTRLVIATPFLSGTFDPATGAINLSGSYTLNGQTIPISVVGTLPFPPATTGGNLTVTISGVAYSSIFGGTVTPTPSPAPTTSPSPNPTPSPNPSPTTPPTPGAVNQVTLTPVAGTSPNNSVSTVVGVTGIATLKEWTTASPFSRIAFELNDGSNHIVNLALITDKPLAPGTYPIKIDSSSFTAPGAGASYREGLGFTMYWQAGGISFSDVEGTLIVDQVDANKVRVQIVNVRIEPRAVGTSTSKGNLRLKGVVETTVAPSFVLQ